MKEQLVKQMIDRFLCWKLPEDFGPDAGIRFAPSPFQTHDGPHWPTGTNLLHAGQAKALFEYLIGDALDGIDEPKGE